MTKARFESFIFCDIGLSGKDIFHIARELGLVSRSRPGPKLSRAIAWGTQ
jgi:hypothetical protein